MMEAGDRGRDRERFDRVAGLEGEGSPHASRNVGDAGSWKKQGISLP